jgi:hypothetical protein
LANILAGQLSVSGRPTVTLSRRILQMRVDLPLQGGVQGDRQLILRDR